MTAVPAPCPPETAGASRCLPQFTMRRSGRQGASRPHYDAALGYASFCNGVDPGPPGASPPSQRPGAPTLSDAAHRCRSSVRRRSNAVRAPCGRGDGPMCTDPLTRTAGSRHGWLRWVTTVAARAGAALAAIVASSAITACAVPVQSASGGGADGGFKGAELGSGKDGAGTPPLDAISDGGADLDGGIAPDAAPDAAIDAPDDTGAPDTPANEASPGDAATPDGDSADSAGDAQGCAPAAKLCPHTFSYSGLGDEGAVEVRGSWNGWKQGSALAANAGVWTALVKLPQGAEFQYKFRITLQDGKESWKADPANPAVADDGFGGKNSVLAALSCPADGICPVAETLCGAAAQPGAFDWRDGVMYFAFVDRFSNGDPANDSPSKDPKVQTIANWAGGDWAGIEQKIVSGYFGALGVNVLWLSVPFDNTDAVELGDDGQFYTAYHGYWPRDTAKTNPRFGSMAALQSLVAKAHAGGIQVVLDYAMNHVHSSSPSYTAHPEWFHPLKVNGQDCVCGAGVCPWDGPTGLSCWFRDYLPDFDMDSAAARKASIDNVLWWLDQSGADGLRLDAIKHVEGAWLTELRQRLNTEFEAKYGRHPWLVGETYTGDAAFIQSFVDPCSKLDGQFDFPLRAVLDQVVLLRQGSMKDLEAFFKKNDTFYGPTAVMSTFAGNHDLPRIIHYAQDVPLYADVWNPGKDKAFVNQPGPVAEQSAYERVFVAMAVLFGSPGVPLIYYGDEIGLAGAGDPDNRRVMPWSGYSAAQTWLLGRHQALGQARKAHAALRRGTRTALWATGDALLWSMTTDGSGGAPADAVWVAVNRGETAQTLQGLPGGQAFADLLGAPGPFSGPAVTVPPRAALYLVAK